MSRAFTKVVSGAKAAGSELQGEIKQAGHTGSSSMNQAGGPYCLLLALPTAHCLLLTTYHLPQAGGISPAAAQHGRQGPLVAAQAALR